MYNSRSNSRVADSTILKYGALVVAFCIRVNSELPLIGPLTDDKLAYIAGVHACAISDTDLRNFHAGFKFFFPWIDKTRVTAELKGLERERSPVPRNPFTACLLLALAFFTRQYYGLPQAVGMCVGFCGLLRPSEILRVRAIDVILRTAFIRVTTIRLQYRTKNGRQRTAELDPNCVGELALKFLLMNFTHGPYSPLFGFDNYQHLYKIIDHFRRHFHLSLLLTPHGLRSGGATHLKLQGLPMEQIMFRGGWSDFQTARGYIDLIFNLLPEVLQAEQSATPNTRHALKSFLADSF